MLPDRFFDEYAKTGPPKQEPAEKTSYTAAEVDKIVTDKVNDAIEDLKKSISEQMERSNEPVIPAEERSESNEENGNE